MNSTSTKKSDEKVSGVLSAAETAKAVSEKLTLAIQKITGQTINSRMSIDEKIAAISHYYESIIACMPNNVYWMDVNSVYQGCNRNVLDMLGFSSQEEIKGKTYQDFAQIGVWKNSQGEKFQADDQKVIATGKPQLNIVDPGLPDENGEMRIRLTSRVPLKNDLGKIIGILGTSIDITEQKQEELRLKSMAKMAAQVAHDIRSPLAALSMLLTSLSELPEEKRVLIRSATQRINDIANNLLVKYRIDKVTEEKDQREVKPELLSSVLDELIYEKRLQFAGRSLDFSFVVSDAAQGVFASVGLNLFNRMISNLINNAAEAIKDKGEIKVTLDALNDRECIIKIIDNGKGIPPELLPTIKEGGHSHGKKGGCGIGIASAIECIHAWGGHYDIESTVGKGTTFLVYLPICQFPEWFQSELIISSGTTLIVLDDDESIHNIWDLRFKSWLDNGLISIKHFKTSADLRIYLKENCDEFVKCLVDYELLDESENGLDIIESTGISGCTTLVTSRYAEKDLQERAIKLGVRIVPKNFAPYVAIKCDAVQQLDLIYIDDDSLIRSAWELRAKLRNRKIKTYPSSEAFKAEMNQFDCATPIYIDSDLGNAERGEQFAKWLFEQGFTELYLATGYQKDKFGQMPWIKEICGKTPPF